MREISLRAFQQDAQDNGARWELADAYVLAGEAHVRLGAFSRAAIDYRAAVDLIRFNDDFANRTKSKTFLAQTHFGMGVLERELAKAHHARDAASVAHRK